MDNPSKAKADLEARNPRGRVAPLQRRALVVLLLSVVFVFCWSHDRWTPREWRSPAGYGGDEWWQLAHVKAMATGETIPILPKYPPSLGAPFGADWNDHPSVEEGIDAWFALLCLLVGLFPAENLALLSAHLLSALAFFYTCRRLRYDPIISAIGALLFSFSYYAFFRGVSHLTLTYYWHVPLGFLVVWWCLARSPFTLRSKKGAVAIAIAIAHGIQSPYYTGLFLQFLVLAALISFMRRSKPSRILVPFALCVIVFATFLLMNVDTFYNRMVHGPNPGIVERNYAGLELYALKPIELLFPTVHRIKALQQWTNERYYQRAFVLGETGSPYLGFVGLAAGLLLVWQVLRAIARPLRHRVPPHFWWIAWIFTYSIIGGINGLFGAFGMILFRCTNRYSIAILALLLLFLVRELTRLVRTRELRKSMVAVLSIIVVLVGLSDQTGAHVEKANLKTWRRMAKQDQALTEKMEASLPPGAMIFQLPVMDSPEAGPIHRLADYEQFRPYFFSRQLRFSYGSNKGRKRDAWQHEVDQLGPTRMVPILEQYGFAAVLISRDAYKDQGREVLRQIGAAGRQKSCGESRDFVCLSLEPAADPLLPPIFDEAWSVLEGSADNNWHWSSGNASILLHYRGSAPRSVHVKFSLVSLQRRELRIALRDQHLTSIALEAASASVPVAFTATLKPGKNELKFESDVPGKVAPGGDQRTLAFQLINFGIAP